MTPQEIKALSLVLFVYFTVILYYFLALVKSNLVKFDNQPSTVDTNADPWLREMC